MDELHIVTALVRNGDELLMVRQAGPGEEPYWTVPGGRSEPGEFVTDALVREVREETGITVHDAGLLAFLAQVDERREGYFATVWTWEVAAWEGEIDCADPDGLVHDAAWVSLSDAIAHLDRISWQPLTARYLRGEVRPGSVWLRRVEAGGAEEWSGPLGAVNQ